ncbi:hypothetical protein P7D22_04710 [Lichenihabitans sp. Uapishka_5]|uniref:hypothetical protein n=1 Tax=Lichenihabitans sp. Uapishka_5 TaxID=3037302 RepID=UPI0029E7EF0D|nr:hypothetical protein [Lichenihabitans sp. Uapishka_5]MDX7950480.1 hypothetical protein [Lichenihabitans sp. Uapishka_5]
MSERKRTTIKLEEPILDGTNVLTEIILRDPLYSDYRECGEVVTYVEDNGRGMPVVIDATVFKYIERCLVSPKSFLLLDHLTLNDGRKLREWLIGFFRRDVAATEGSTTSSPTSSGEPAASPSPTP